MENSIQIPTPIYRKNYKPSAFSITDVHLTFNLNPQKTIVTAKLECQQHLDRSQEPLILFGKNLKLISIKLNQNNLDSTAYQVTENELIIYKVPQNFSLTTECEIYPDQNTELMGLFTSNDIFCTQCEPQGFRKITYFLDRPDVLARYTTVIIANREKYPVLLSNGNCIEEKMLANGEHQATWQDPFPKPSYLFALVAGNLFCASDFFITQSQKKVALKIFVEPEDHHKTAYALEALKKAMLWDEKTYGREYDLNIFMIVAIKDFNMGAMENKGLNIFNAKYVLADPKSATDQDYESILSVIGHEYFHNWTGNRVTCRDWFQLSLKEGLTIFRDQNFSRDTLNSALCRIDDVRLLRSSQFPEDSGPLSHPVLPDSYVEINNFYTSTIYNKGAEIIRMLSNILGSDGFRQGINLYFERHDGQAVTIHDFLRAMSDANTFDLENFENWYKYSGTPSVKASFNYDEEKSTLMLTLTQHNAKTEQPFFIPVQLSLYDSQTHLPLNLKNSNASEKNVLMFNQKKQTFVFEHILSKPIVSLFQNFSAPVQLKDPYLLEELIFLARYDQDEFNRYEAWNRLLTKTLIEAYQSALNDQTYTLDTSILDLFLFTLEEPHIELGLKSLLLSFPDENYMIEQIENIHILLFHQIYQQLKEEFAIKNKNALLKAYETHLSTSPYHYNAIDVGRRRLINVLLNYLSYASYKDSSLTELIFEHYQHANNMTDALSGLHALCIQKTPHTEEALQHFYHQWKEEPIVLDKWFMVQAASHKIGTLAHIQYLMSHPDFTLENPNRARSLLMPFSKQNLENFHDTQGKGYELLMNAIFQSDSKNPQLSARLAESLTSWKKYASPQKELMKHALEKLILKKDISNDLYEIVSKSLGVL